MDQPYELQVDGKRVGRYATGALAMQAGDRLAKPYVVLLDGRVWQEHPVRRDTGIF